MQTQAHDEGVSSCGVTCVKFSPTFHSSGWFAICQKVSIIDARNSSLRRMCAFHSCTSMCESH